ncbi:unnamed protein product, partial [Ectocarpus sp. 4 AP-2014]
RRRRRIRRWTLRWDPRAEETMPRELRLAERRAAERMGGDRLGEARRVRGASVPNHPEPPRRSPTRGDFLHNRGDVRPNGKAFVA